VNKLIHNIRSRIGGIESATKSELRLVLMAASEKCNSETPEGKKGDEVHYWLTYALYYGIEAAIIKWAGDLK
jgi:hypothetical protein